MTLEKKQSKQSQWGCGLVPPLPEARVGGQAWKPVGGHWLMGWGQCQWHGWHTPPSCPDMNSGAFRQGNAFRLLEHFWKNHSAYVCGQNSLLLFHACN